MFFVELKLCRLYMLYTIEIIRKLLILIGKIGQPLCLMLKQCPLIDELCMHDVKATSGFALELNHVDTDCKATAFTGRENLAQALEVSRLIVQ